MDWDVFDFVVSHWNELGFLFFGAVVFAVWFLVAYRKARESLSWPVASGKVLGSRVIEKKRGDEKNYKAEIIYEYHVNGELNIGDLTRFFGAEADSRREAEKFVRQYAAGRIVTVAFNPEKPAKAVLEPGKAQWWPALVGLACVVGALGSLLGIANWDGMVFVCIGLGVVGWSIADHRRHQKALDWPMTSARVVSSSVVQDGRVFKRYTPEILYEYQVAGNTYVADVWESAYADSSKREAEKAVASHPLGEILAIHFNPDKPSEAFLIPPKTDWRIVLVGACFVVFALVSMLASKG